MISGVTLNGRNFSQGDSCLYVPIVPRRYNQPGVGGQDGTSTSHLLGIINMFYTFTLPLGDVTFVSLYNLPIEHKLRSLYVTRTVVRNIQPGFADAYTTNQVLIHIDSITAKLFLVPHFNPTYRSDFMCGIPMWDSR